MSQENDSSKIIASIIVGVFSAIVGGFMLNIFAGVIFGFLLFVFLISHDD